MDVKQGLSLNLEQKASLLVTLKAEIIAASSAEIEERIQKEVENNPALLVKERPVSYLGDYRRVKIKDGDERVDWIERTAKYKESLTEHLLFQLGCLDISDEVRKDAETIITSLDDKGFLEDSDLKDNIKNFGKALDIVKSLEPTGVGASNWKESILLQAEKETEDEKDLSLIKAMLYDEEKLLSEKNFSRLAVKLKSDENKIENLYTLIKSLTPFPGYAFSPSFDNYITPDIIIKKNAEGNLEIMMGEYAYPLLEVDPSFLSLLEENKEGGKEWKNIKRKINDAKSLINLISYRTTTLEKLASFLLKTQYSFFLEGPLHLTAVTMKEAAKEIGVDESTISRAALSKYIDTDFGIFPVRYFFSSSVETESGSISRTSVKEIIKTIIDENDKKLTDGEIMNLLNERGIKISRRTVAKYRTEMNIDSSWHR